MDILALRNAQTPTQKQKGEGSDRGNATRQNKIIIGSMTKNNHRAAHATGT